MHHSRPSRKWGNYSLAGFLIVGTEGIKLCETLKTAPHPPSSSLGEFFLPSLTTSFYFFSSSNSPRCAFSQPPGFCPQLVYLEDSSGQEMSSSLRDHGARPRAGHTVGAQGKPVVSCLSANPSDPPEGGRRKEGRRGACPGTIQAQGFLLFSPHKTKITPTSPGRHSADGLQG